MYSNIAKNKRNSWLLIGLFIIIITLFGFLFAQVFDNQSILVWCLVISTVYAFISYYNSDKMVLAVSGARAVEKRDAPELYRIVENLAMTAGLPTPKVYIIPDAAPNAFATGRDPKHAVVAVTTGILERLDKTELEGVIAHELSHVGNYDIRLMALVTVLVAVIAMLADWFLRFAFWGGDDDNGGGQARMILIAVGLALSIIVPIIGTIIQLSVSRKREYLADASGALLTRYPKGLADALRKISDDTKPLKHANKATANLYIINPLRANVKSNRGGSWAANLFSTHPPIEERIKKLTEMEDTV